MSRNTQTIQVVFILSARHSGSTWLNLVLGSHDWASAVGEYYRPFLHPGHIACRLCEARGLEQCEALGDVSTISTREAFRHASACLNTNVIIDSSKRFDWVQSFAQQADHDVRLIHLIRHPCGYIASRQRRNSDETAEQALSEWASTNHEIADFIQQGQNESICLSYEALTLNMKPTFQWLTRFLDQDFDPAALCYWNYEHHGLGGNGANYAYLKDLPNSIYRTGDDTFYERFARQTHLHDDRWRRELDKETIAACAASEAVEEVVKHLEEAPEWTF